MEKELEVKVLGLDLIDIEKRVVKLGGKLIAKEEQTNTLIDSRARPIKSYLDAYLRIRESRDLLNNEFKTTFTLKKKIRTDGLRENQELNVEIQDKEIMLRILKDLGFNDIELGHKERKSYEFMGARLDFDQWDEKTYPYPYLEIEVKGAKHLNEVLSLLQIPRENVSTKSIVELRKELKLI